MSVDTLNDGSQHPKPVKVKCKVQDINVRENACYQSPQLATTNLCTFVQGRDIHLAAQAIVTTTARVATPAMTGYLGMSLHLGAPAIISPIPPYPARWSNAALRFLTKRAE